jgi:hypothetical protein
MRKLKYSILMILSVVLLNSCWEDTTELDLNKESNNVAGFEFGSQNIAAVADGNAYEFEIKMKVKGPTSMDLTEDVTVTVAAAEASTAIEGTHFSIDVPTLTLKADNNYLGLFKITMLTEGIETPLDESPILILEATAVTGPDNVVPSGKPITITMNYACFSDLAGTYDVAVLRDGAPISPYSVVTVTETGIGEYRTSEVGHWGQATLGGTPGFTFYDVCNVITIPGQNLVDLYSNWVNSDGVDPGAVDPETGVITLAYKITSTWESLYEWTLTPQK